MVSGTGRTSNPPYVNSIVSLARITAITWLQPRILHRSSENAPLGAEEEEFLLTIATAQLEHQHAYEETQAVVDEGNYQERRAL
jgi:hypothetical protein